MTKTQAMVRLRRIVNAMPFRDREKALQTDPELIALRAVLRGPIQSLTPSEE